jgi:hypothetical protein
MLIGYPLPTNNFLQASCSSMCRWPRERASPLPCVPTTSILGASARGIADSHGPGWGQPCKQPASHLASSVHRDSVTILLSSLKPRPPSPPLCLQQLDDFLIQSQGRYAVQRWGA